MRRRRCIIIIVKIDSEIAVFDAVVVVVGWLLMTSPTATGTIDVKMNLLCLLLLLLLLLLWRRYLAWSWSWSCCCCCCCLAVVSQAHSEESIHNTVHVCVCVCVSVSLVCWIRPCMHERTPSFRCRSALLPTYCTVFLLHLRRRFCLCCMYRIDTPGKNASWKETFLQFIIAWRWSCFLFTFSLWRYYLSYVVQCCLI